MAASAMYADTTQCMCVVSARALWPAASPFAAKRTVKPMVQVSLHGNHIGRPLTSGGMTG
jgi:hypothetical protein